MEYLPIWNLKYNIDKEYYLNLFYDNISPQGRGCKHDQFWHQQCSKRKELFWYQLFCFDDTDLKREVEKVEKDLNIFGCKTYPRFNYQFPNSELEYHKDENNIVSININLFDTKPIIHLAESKIVKRKKHVIESAYEYEAIFVDVGKCYHSVKPDTNHRLLLKICIEDTFENVFERLSSVGLIEFAEPISVVENVDKVDK